MLPNFPHVQEVRVITRDARRAQFLKKEDRKIQICEGDIRDPDFLKGCTEYVTRIFHLAGLKPEKIGAVTEKEFFEINRDATVRLAEIASSQGTKRFIHFSSTGVYGDVPGPRLDEDSLPNPADPYERSKLAAETALESLARHSPMEIVILRPSNVFGEHHPRRHLLNIIRTIQRRLFFLSNPSGWVNYIYVDDVSSGALRIGFLPDAIPSTSRFILNCPCPVEDFARHIAHVLSVPDRFPRVPVGLMMATAWACDQLRKTARVSVPLTMGKVKELSNPKYFDATRAMTLLNGWPPIGIHVGLQRTADHYRLQGWL